MKIPSSITRRSFTKSLGSTLALGPTLLSSYLSTHANARPNNKITLGIIGVGMMGRGHLQRFLRNPQAEVVAVCDVEQTRLEEAWKSVHQTYAEQRKTGSYHGCAAYSDFRDLLSRRDIDAVVIATPDHWHVTMAILAAQAGKDIYCEKPLTLFVAEGRRLVNTIRHHKTIFQTGSQQRSEFGGKFHRAAELIRNGRIGKVQRISIGVGAPPIPCDLPELEAPNDVNWDLWIGPAPYRGYNEILCPRGIHKHFPAFRNYREYAGGALADIGAHHFDIAQWALGMDQSGPVRIDPPSSPDLQGLKFTYANGIEMTHGGEVSCRFEGSNGVLEVARNFIRSTPESILQEIIGPSETHLYHATNHHENWLDCIRSRALPICDVEIGHRTATLCHLASIGYELRRPLQWNPSQEQFVDDIEANQKLTRINRAPWNIS